MNMTHNLDLIEFIYDAVHYHVTEYASSRFDLEYSFTSQEMSPFISYSCSSNSQVSKFLKRFLSQRGVLLTLLETFFGKVVLKNSFKIFLSPRAEL